MVAVDVDVLEDVVVDVLVDVDVDMREVVVIFEHASNVVGHTSFGPAASKS